MYLNTFELTLFWILNIFGLLLTATLTVVGYHLAVEQVGPVLAYGVAACFLVLGNGLGALIGVAVNRLCKRYLPHKVPNLL